MTLFVMDGLLCDLYPYPISKPSYNVQQYCSNCFALNTRNQRFSTNLQQVLMNIHDFCKSHIYRLPSRLSKPCQPFLATQVIEKAKVTWSGVCIRKVKHHDAFNKLREKRTGTWLLRFFASQKTSKSEHASVFMHIIVICFGVSNPYIHVWQRRKGQF